MKIIAALVVIQVVSAATIVGIRLGCADDCEDIYSPVCATNGKTYSNLCECNIASCKADFTFEFSHYGVCENNVKMPERAVCPGVCPAVYNPVCGSNGKTYSNECVLNYHKCLESDSFILASTGPCNGN